MATLSLEDAIAQAGSDVFWAQRGKAIQGYANLEQALSLLFAVLSDTTQEVASIIFFKITSADARNKIIEKLFQKKFAATHSLFRNSLFKNLGPIDRERNEIVHWNVVNHVSAGADGSTVSKLLLSPPAMWLTTATAPTKSADDIAAFSVKCEFYSRLIGLFAMYVRPPSAMPADAWKDWLPHFEQPIVYPPPADHPLASISQPGSANTFALG
ncbi:hypothetical protein AB8A05_29690 [Tardiphaga sp. 538_B7_N1_4]|uniref:hypothetical protein n=1 Tax=Tardiphaga sp. 538_B7_N1_4 TaxID=3240778 RepID=UPI003F20D6D1